MTELENHQPDAHYSSKGKNGVIVVDLQDSEGLTALMYATFTSSRGSSDDYSCLAFSADRARDAARPQERSPSASGRGRSVLPEAAV